MANSIGLVLAISAFLIGGIAYFSKDLQLLHDKHPLVGTIPPDIAFQMDDGRERRLHDGAGKVVLVNFWASWCQPCMDEMPALAALENHFGGRGFELLAFNIAESPSEMTGRIGDTKMPRNLIYHFSKSYLRPYDVNALPLSILLGRDGKVREVFLGPRNWAEIRYLKQIEELLK